MSNNRYSRLRDRHAFEITIFCALGLEADAMIAMFDEIWEQEEQYEKYHGDTNSYTDYIVPSSITSASSYLVDGPSSGIWPFALLYFPTPLDFFEALGTSSRIF
jgi:hypothetical protein